MGACVSSDNIEEEDVERWKKKKKETKGACVPKVDYVPLAMSNDIRKMSSRIGTHKHFEKAKTQEDNRAAEQAKKDKDAAARAHTSHAQEVLWIPHKGLASYKELSEEFGTKNKKALVRMASEAHLKKTGGGEYSSSNAEKAASANEKMKRSKSSRTN